MRKRGFNWGFLAVWLVFCGMLTMAAYVITSEICVRLEKAEAEANQKK